MLQSRASLPVLTVTTLAITVGTLIPYTAFGARLSMSPLPLAYFPWLIGMIFAYMALATIMKKVYIRKYGELL